MLRLDITLAAAHACGKLAACRRACRDIADRSAAIFWRTPRPRSARALGRQRHEGLIDSTLAFQKFRCAATGMAKAIPHDVVRLPRFTHVSLRTVESPLEGFAVRRAVSAPRRAADGVRWAACRGLIWRRCAERPGSRGSPSLRRWRKRLAIGGSRPRQKLDHLRAKGAPVSSRREQGKQAAPALCCRCRGIRLRQDSEQLHEQFDDVGFTRTFFDQPFQILHGSGGTPSSRNSARLAAGPMIPAPAHIASICCRNASGVAASRWRVAGALEKPQNHRTRMRTHVWIRYGSRGMLRQGRFPHYCWHFVERPSWTG